MIPVLIAAAAGAVVGGTAVAILRDDKKSDGQWREEVTTRVISESELPPDILDKVKMKRILSENDLPNYAKLKLAEKRNNRSATTTGSSFICSNSFEYDFTRIENMISRDDDIDIIRDALQKIAKRADSHHNAEAMNMVAIYYQKIYDYDSAQRCFERGKILARS